MPIETSAPFALFGVDTAIFLHGKDNSSEEPTNFLLRSVEGDASMFMRLWHSSIGDGIPLKGVSEFGGLTDPREIVNGDLTGDGSGMRVPTRGSLSCGDEKVQSGISQWSLNVFIGA